MKGSQTCIYADKRPDPASKTDKGAFPEATSGPLPPAQARQSIPPWQSSPEHNLGHSQPLLETGSPGTIELQNFQRHPSTTSPNGFFLGNHTNVPPDSAAQQVMSPEMSYAGTMGSNDTGSLVARSVSSQPTFNVAITRWFDMLVGDSAFENGFSDLDVGMEEPINFDTPREHREQDRMGAPYMGPYISTPTAVGNEAPSPSSSSPQLLERSAPGPDRNAIAEKLKWQTPAVIELLPYEQLIFQNFVQRISAWVRHWLLKS